MLPFFPPPPRLRGRAAEIETLARTVEVTAPARLALVGSGGSGKSLLAAALGHRLAQRFENRVHWFRVGPWDARTMGEMLALRFGTSRARAELFPELRALFAHGGERLIVLDNHEDDRAMARFLDALAGVPVSFVITARRCLLAGVLIFPVTAPLVTAGRSAFPRVARLTRPLRWNPLALDIADAIVAFGRRDGPALGEFLEAKGVARVRVIDHEDDLPEVALLVDWAWPRLGAGSRRAARRALARRGGQRRPRRRSRTSSRIKRCGACPRAPPAMAPRARADAGALHRPRRRSPRREAPHRGATRSARSSTTCRFSSASRIA